MSEILRKRTSPPLTYLEEEPETASEDNTKGYKEMLLAKPLAIRSQLYSVMEEQSCI